MKYNVIERFLSVDGEGPTAGEIATFIRFGGCNLACTWCDTAYSIDSNIVGELLSMEEIYKFIKDNRTKNVTLTGGEPLLQQNIEDLIDYLSKDSSLLIHIETNGALPIYKLNKLKKQENISFIIDYKLPSSGMESQMDLKNYEVVTQKDVCKFVIGTKEDLIKAKEIVEHYKLADKCLIYFSPIIPGMEPITIVEFMKENSMNHIRLQIQLHKILWTPETRGV